MDKPAKGKTLLVGEGDFSFTVAMVTRFPPTPEKEVISTSIETPESITKHKNATENMELLKKQGVRVYLEVDATKLDEHEILKDEKYARILFNFPHAGGKSNHKRNRKLLNDFFGSAVHVLEDEGQILVTLCKGQGGTPADRPLRAWHDSWQVVSMAANSSLILVEAVPFQVEDYEAYTSTGFRSLDKSFHTDNAITHVFEKAEPVEVPDCTEEYEVFVGDETYTCGRYIFHKLQTIRKMEVMASHPFNIISQQLAKLLIAEDSFLKIPFDCTSSVSSNDINPDPKVLPTTDTDEKNCENSAHNSCKCEHCYVLKKRTETDRADGNFKAPPNTFTFTNLNFICDTEDEFNNLYLTTSLLQNINFTEPLSEKCFHSEKGPVFLKCPIKTGQLPVQYQKLIVWSDSLIETNSGHVENEIEKKLKETTDIENIDKDIKLKSYEVKVDKEVEFQLQTGHRQEMPPSVANKIERILQILKILVGENYNIQFHTQLNKAASSKDLFVENNVKHNFRSLGYFVIVLDTEDGERLMTIGELSEISFKNQVEHPNYLALLLFLDDIASVKFDVRDKRLLYSSEKCLINQFIQFQSVTDHNDSNIRIPSLYPMTFVHDMSFWENEEVDFDETEFCNVIRDIAGDTVIHVELIDSYRDPATGRHSRCYRMTFQSPDKALCYDTSWKLQSLIRLEVQRSLKIKLR